MKFAFIRDHQEQFPVEIQCAVLDVSLTGFDAWRKWPASPFEVRREELVEKIRDVRCDSRKTYGSPRVFHALKASGVACCENTVAKLMRAKSLLA